MDRNILKTLDQRYPFLTVCSYAGNEYVGVIQNRDDSVTTIYDFGVLQESVSKLKFLELAAVWWWESNRSIPINIFLKSEWEPFRVCLRTFSNRDLEILHGPVCSLTDINRRKSKRKAITLVRRID
jgi:hypothetical protein